MAWDKRSQRAHDLDRVVEQLIDGAMESASGGTPGSRGCGASASGVGAEGGELLGRHELVDPAPGLDDMVEIVGPLVALVAQPSVVLEADGSGHRAARHRVRAAGPR